MDSKTVLAQLTLEEKASLCSGKDFWTLKSVERLGLKSIMVTDGPHGLRKQVSDSDHLGINKSVPATCFPAACASSSSFDRALLREIGAAMGEECLQENVAVILGPGANIKRSPLCGRNFEYISEDPFVAGELAAALITGVQSKGVGTSLKHYAANNQESRRLTIDSVVDERALREIYLTGFEKTVKQAQPWTVMCSYNRLNGTYASENKKLLSDILRDEWGFTGLVVTDWGAINDRVEGAKAGLDLEMPGSGGANDAKLVAAVKAGTLSEAALDKVTLRIIELILKAQESAKPGFTYNAAAHHALARRAAAESTVLLKNESAALPLSTEKTLAVIGAFAKTPRYQGAGSSKINPIKLDNAFDALKDAGFNAEYAAGYTLGTGNTVDPALIDEACALAKKQNIAVIFAGLPDEYESEGFDRKTLDMPESHNALIEAVAKVNPNTVVVLQLGAPVLLPWADKVKSILVAYLGGQASGGAIADVLSGACYPSGKLTETWPLSLEDTPSYGNFPGGTKTVEYRESIFVGYRYYELSTHPVAYPFGYGLSYTSFEYSDLRLDRETFASGDAPLTVRVTVKNTGSRAGAEVAQLYVAAPQSSALYRACKELKGFEKVALAPGASTEVTFTLDARSFAYYNTMVSDWAIEGGAYMILVGASSADIRLQAPVTVQGDGKESKLASLRAAAPCYFSIGSTPGRPCVSDASFTAVYGRALPPAERAPGELFTVNSTLSEFKDTPVGEKLAAFIARGVQDAFAGDNDISLIIDTMIGDMPLRTLAMMGGDKFPASAITALVDALNGNPSPEILALLG